MKSTYAHYFGATNDKNSLDNSNKLNYKKNMKRRLPSLNALRAFEAAARLGRVNGAAEELNVTPAAVSHQIKSLEEYFGVSLFRRSVRRISLTRAGETLLPQVTDGFDQLAAACKLLLSEEETGILTVSAPPTLAAKWLVQRLQDFNMRHPEISVRLDGSVGLTRFEEDDVDVAIRFGAGPYEDLHAEPLIAETVLAVCAPSLLNGDKPLKTPEDLAHHTLLHVDWQSKSGAKVDWTMWLKLAGVEHIDGRRGPQFNSEHLSLATAVEGHGIALVGEVHARDELASGRVVQLFDLVLPTEFHYWLVCPPQYLDRPKVKAFRDWIVAEAASEV